MDLTFSSSAGHPLIRNPNGTLRLGRWWGIAPAATHFIAENIVGASTYTRYSSSMMTTSITGLTDQAKQWTTVSTGVYDAFAGIQCGEDYPYNRDEFCWAFAVSRLALYSFSIPSALQSRTIRAAVVAVAGGGCTRLKFAADAPNYYPYPVVADVWTYGTATFQFKLATSKPSRPQLAFGSPTFYVYDNSLTDTSVAAGVPIVWDSSNYWTVFGGSVYTEISAPPAVAASLTGASTVWCSVRPNIGSMTRSSDYSRPEYTQNARTGSAPYLWVYA